MIEQNISSQSQPCGAPESAATEADASAACGCIAQMNEVLAPHNAALITTMFSKPEAVTLETYKVDSAKRGFRPPRVLASYCPFCGEKYDKARGQS